MEEKNELVEIAQYFIPGWAAFKMYKGLRKKGGGVGYSLGTAVGCEVMRDALLGATIYTQIKEPAHNTIYGAVFTDVCLNFFYTAMSYGPLGLAAHDTLEKKIREKEINNLKEGQK